MPHTRIIARLDIKGPNLIKGIHLEGLRVIGDPNKYARRYYEDGADELLYMDAVASLYERNSLTDIIRYTAKNIFIPFTVGGGIRSIDDIAEILRAGADKVAINTAAVRQPELLKQSSQKFGKQCIVLSIEAKKQPDGRWEAYTDNGREHTGLDVVEWAQLGTKLGAGEILLTSIDREGTRRGFDLELVKAVTEAVSVPVIASGGYGTESDFEAVVKESNASAIAIADALHYQRLNLKDLRSYATKTSISVRIT